MKVGQHPQPTTNMNNCLIRIFVDGTQQNIVNNSKITTMKYYFILLISLILSCNGDAQQSFVEIAYDLNMAASTMAQKGKVVELDLGETDAIKTIYLGILQGTGGRDFFVFNTIFIDNKKISPRHSNYVMIYSENKEYIGYYYLSLTPQLPKRISKNRLIFKDQCTGEDIIISFSNGIPRDINIGCEGNPDFYEFIKSK